MDLALTGKVAVILAASRGLGRAVAEAFAREGARVIIASRSAERLNRAAKEITAATGAEVHAHPCDMTSPNEIAGLIRFAIEELGGVDVLVNNSGGPKAGNFEDLTDEDWHAAHELTLLSFMRSIRLALPSMRTRGGGRIVNMTSLTVRQPLPNLLLSNVYRAGVAGLTKSLAGELAPQGILINTVAPGFIDTERVQELMEDKAKRAGTSVGDARRGITDQIPLGRMGEPDELARAVVWLGSWANTYLTGQVVLVDGGMVKSL